MSRARDLFVLYNGRGPWPCFFCNQAIQEETNITAEELVVHHHDRNRKNNRKRNLKGSHRRCHQRYHTMGNRHLRGFSPSERTRRLLSIAGSRPRKPLSEETKRKISASLMGNKNSTKGARDG